jgi:hypothetical protein
MKFPSIVLILASALTASAHPLTNTSLSPYNPISPTQGALASRAYKPQHGLCNIWVELTELLPRQNPVRSDIQVRLTDNKQVMLTSPVWFNGHAIGERQRLDETIWLNDVIEPGSELRIDWTEAGERKSTREGPDWLQFEYLLHRGGTENAVIVFNDHPNVEDWGFARCKRLDEWVEQQQTRVRHVSCDFNC